MEGYTVKDGAITYSDGTTLTYDGLVEKMESLEHENPELYNAILEGSGKTIEEHKTYLRECFDNLKHIEFEHKEEG